MQLIPAQMQRVWKLPAVINFSCGGIGAGFYLVGLLLIQTPGGDLPTLLLHTGLFKLLGPALVGLGFVALTTEAGRPRRGINLFRHLRRSWMSRETLAAALFLPAAGLDWLFPHPAVRGIAALAALALLVCQGFIVYRARGVTAWNVGLMPILFVTSGLACGSGLSLLAVALYDALFSPGIQAVLPLPLVGLAGAIVNTVVWLVYLQISDKGFRRATEALRRPNSLVLIVGVGHVLPAMLLLLALLGNFAGASLLFFEAISGLALIFGGVSQKFGIIMGAGYLRAIALPMPVRQAVADSGVTVGH